MRRGVTAERERDVARVTTGTGRARVARVVEVGRKVALLCRKGNDGANAGDAIVVRSGGGGCKLLSGSGE